MKYTILITGTLHPSSIEKFFSNPSFDVHYYPDSAREKWWDLLPSAYVLVTRSETPIDREILDRAKKLRFIGRAAVGVGNIDLDYATKKGILVINCPGKNTNSAAELTFALILAMIRKVPQAHEELKKGGWNRHLFTGEELKGKKIGLLGLGNVGHRVAEIAHGFQMKIYAYDPYISPLKFKHYRTIPCQSIKEISQNIDILSCHVPLNKETRNMIGEAVLRNMPAGSYLVNCARGGIVNENDLLRVLDSGHLQAAAIDTWENEPHPAKNLVEHPHIWASPHIGASTIQAQKIIGLTIYEQVRKALAGDVVDYPVNLPKIASMDQPIVKSYVVLAEKLGRLIGQFIDFHVQEMTIYYRGDLAACHKTFLRLAIMKGFLSQHTENYISYVNCESHFRSLGIEFTEDNDPSFSSYKSAIKIKVSGEKQILTFGGIVFDQTYQRISLINGFWFEFSPTGSFIISENKDYPGVIGALGGYLGKENINIISFDLSRNSRLERAMAVVKIDHQLTEEQLTGIRHLDHILSVRQIHL